MRLARVSRLPLVLGLAVLACAFAFWWVADPAARTGPPPAVETTGVAPAVPSPTGTAPRSAAVPSTGVPAERRTVSVMTLGNELTAEQIAEFEASNPDIRIAFFEFSANLLDILIATDDLPDVFRLGQVEHLPLVRRGLLLDLTDRIARSRVIAFEDMRPETSAEVAVDGRYYGLSQGFATPDFASLYIDTAAFAAAGLAVPSLSEPMTYAELAPILRRLTAHSGRPAFYSFFFERVLSATLAQRGTRMFREDFGEMTLTQNPQALEVVRYFYELALAGAMHVPPATPAIAALFENGELAVSQSGYWMGATIAPGHAVHGRATMLPAPVWDRSLPRVGSFLGGTKLVISARSTEADAAYRFVEWYAAGKPAHERARRGWGFPLLRSMEPLLPQESALDRQRLHVALDALTLPVAALPNYPHPGILPAFNRSWTKNLGLAKDGRLAFAEFASNLQEDVNLAIRDDIAGRTNQALR